MPCSWLKLPDGTVAHMRTSKRLAKCHTCGLLSEFQCDFPTGRDGSGKKNTCDRHLCRDHVRPGKTKGIDFCEEHHGIAKAAYERRRNASTG